MIARMERKMERHGNEATGIIKKKQGKFCFYGTKERLENEKVQEHLESGPIERIIQDPCLLGFAIRQSSSGCKKTIYIETEYKTGRIRTSS